MRYKYMYTLSPVFTKAMMKEARPYSFIYKGYVTPKAAIDNLLYVNQADIEGYIIAYDILPEDLYEVVEYINYINTIATDKVVVLYLQDEEGYEELLHRVNKDNLKLMLVVNEELTDVVIRRDLFGTILKHTRKPYEQKHIEFQEFPIKTLKYIPLLPRHLSLVIQDIPKSIDYTRCKESDKILTELARSNVGLALRLFKIARHWGVNLEKRTEDVLKASKATALEYAVFNYLKQEPIGGI